ncbi:hypothetical protein ACWA2C_16710 [Priestia megaterium]
MKEKDFQLELVFNPDGQEQKRMIVNDVDKYSWISKKQLEAYRAQLEKENMRLRDKRGDFVMGKSENIRLLEETDLTVSDRRYFMILVLYARFNGEPLTKDGVALNNKSIGEIWEISDPKTISKRLNKFVKLGLLEKIKNGRVSNYVLNELYFQMGKGKKHHIDPGEKFVKLFKNQLSNVISNVRKIEQNKNRRRKTGQVNLKDVIGLLHAVMPYFHYETYYLVSNPDERITLEGESVLDAVKRDPKQLKHLSKSQIGRILGYENANRATISRYMDILQRSGAVMVLQNNSRTRYLIHPDLMFRLDSDGTDEYTEYVRQLFGQHK